MERWVAKLLAGIILFVLPLICTIIPVKMSGYVARRGAEGKLLMSRLMCFGGGVFFCTFLLHMIPEVKAILEESLLVPNNITYPVAELLMGAGFFLVLTIETAAMKGQNRHRSRSTPMNEIKIAPGGGQEYVMVNGEELIEINASKSVENGTLTVQPAENVDVVPRGQHNQVDVIPRGQHEEEAPHHHSRSLVLAIALSLHRIFEGMSVGLKLTVLGVWSMFIAVICHEAIIGFSLGLQFMLNSNTVRRNLIYATICSIIMPIGVAIGTAMVEFGEHVPGLDIANGVLQAISTGTFIYVTFFEILHEEFTHESYEVGNVLSLAFGFCVMAAINAIPEQEGILDGMVNATSVPSEELMQL